MKFSIALLPIAIVGKKLLPLLISGYGYVSGNRERRHEMTDWTKVPIARSYFDLFENYGNPENPFFEDNFLTTLPHFLADGTPIHVRCHDSAVASLHIIFATCGDLIHTFDGCYANRVVRGGTAKSLHAWGLAIDINSALFPLGSTRRQDARLIKAFHDQGWWYGGDYHHRLDPMHWQRAGDI